MNRPLILWGLVVLVFGLIFNFLLFELQFETFREDLEPWRLVAITITIAGGIASLGGLVLPRLTLILRR